MNEARIRDVLAGTIRVADPDVVLVPEYPVGWGAARVDLLALNGSIHGYEIKSPRDTLARLPRQVDHYNASLEFVTLVVADCHLSKALKVIPRWWGVISVGTGGDEVALTTLRAPMANPEGDKVEIC